MSYPKRGWELGSEDPDFRRADPVNDAEAFCRAVALRRSVMKHLGEDTPPVRRTILWEDPGEFCWEILPEKEEDGRKPPSRRVSAQEFFRVGP